jgi:hypothetical protein
MRSAILTCPPIRYRPPASASASLSLNWSTAAGGRGHRIRPAMKAGTARERGAADPAPRSGAA